MRFFKRSSREESYKRYRVAREAIELGVFRPEDPQMVAAKAELTRDLGPAFDPTIGAWERLDLIDDLGFREFVTSSIDPSKEDKENLDAFAEQMLAIVGLGIEDVTGGVILESANNFNEAVAFRLSRRLQQDGILPEVADATASRFAHDTTIRYFAFARTNAG